MVNKKINKIKDKFSLKEKILKYLIENKKPQSILQISRGIKADYKNTFQAIKSQPDLVIQDKRGNTTFIEIKMAPNQGLYSVEEKRKQEFLGKNPKLKLIKEDIEEIEYPFMIVLLFGSYAKGTNTQTSDIDICIICDNKEKIKKLFDRLSLLSMKLEIHEFTTNEFISMISKKEDNLGHEIIKNNIILYGTENYYNLISKWTKKE